MCAISYEEGRANKGDHEGPVGPSFVSVCHTLPHKLPPLAKSCDRTGVQWCHEQGDEALPRWNQGACYDE
ncbi:hypothetical protein VAWG004_36650 [Aeromonas veronii]|nr:hypothetical protein VAWG004_36650 [Aeromonas veronii]